MLVSTDLSAHLTRMEVPFILIGGVALASWGVSRFTADVDLLTLEPRVLARTIDGQLPHLSPHAAGFWKKIQTLR
jgi:hypothetical protein